ncbi:MAG: insulinase family protein [Pyrinomonadaceae bacterium]|nr:insulinase family protein [Pyrinomonadaceae bacterium]
MRKIRYVMRSLLATSLLLSVLTSAFAQVVVQQSAQQQGDSKGQNLSKIERKGRAPLSKEVLKVKLPRPIEAKLDNGLTVLILEDSRFPTVNVQFAINGAGALYEPANMPGLASATAQMLREGTKTRASKQIAEEVDRLGATLGAFSGFGSIQTNVTASGLSDNFDQWFALTTDILMNPTFPAEELAKFKMRLKAQLRQQRSSPDFLANEQFARAVYGNHPASIVAATNESVDALTPEILANWQKTRYAPQNTILGIAGDVKASEIIPKLKQALAGWQKTDAAEVLPQNPTPAAQKKIIVVNRPDSVQTTMAMGNIAIDRRSPDYPAMVVMDNIIGSGGSARLFMKLREEQGLTYGAYSFFTAVKYPGPWRAGGDFRTEVTEQAMTGFLNEINRIRDEKVSADELEENKRSVVASFALSLEQPTQLLSYEITRRIYGFPEDYWETYPARIMAVTADDVQRVARKYLNPESLQIVAVGDASKIKTVLEKFGTVTVYDAEGKQEGAKPSATTNTVTRPGQ